MPAIFRNSAASALAAQAQINDTTISVTTGTGNRFPAPTANEWFFATIQSGVNYEIVKCTARAGDVLTVVRAQDGTSAQLWNAGTSIDLRIPKVVLESFLQQGEIARVAAGSAATPSVSFSGDTDTGIYQSVVGEIAATINGVQKLRLNGTGLGLNASPVNDLTVGGNGVTLAADYTSLVGNAYFDGAWRYASNGAAWGIGNNFGGPANGFCIANAAVNSSGSGAALTWNPRLAVLQSGQIQSIGSGTVAAPAYSFSGDPDTGIYGPAAGEIAVTINGADAYRMRASGTRHHFLGADGATIHLISGTTRGIRVSTDTSNAYLDAVDNTGGASYQPLVLRGLDISLSAGSSPVERLRIPATGAITMAGPVNVTSGGQTVTGDLEASGNLRFNSGYGSAAIAYGVRAWVNFNGTGTVAIRGSGGVTSITDNGVGDYTVNFNFTMPDTNYGVVGSASAQANYPAWAIAVAHNVAPTTTGVRVYCGATGASGALGYNADSQYVSIFIVR